MFNSRLSTPVWRLDNLWIRRNFNHCWTIDINLSAQTVVIRPQWRTLSTPNPYQRLTARPAKVFRTQYEHLHYPTGRKFLLEFKLRCSLMANSLNLNSVYYYIFRNLSMIAYIIEIQNQNSLIFNSVNSTNLSQVA